MPRTAEFTKLSSHVIGSDQVGREVNVQPEVPVEGIYGSSGFYFQQRRGRLDLRSLAQIDLEKVVRDVDIDVLQMSLENICFCNLREEDLRFITDQHVVKIFRAAQLVIEYLLYAQEQLADNCNVLSNKYMAKKRSVLRKRKELVELQENSKVLRAQLRSKKKSIKTLEQLLKDASRNKRRDDTADSKAPKESISEPKRPSILRFFVSNSNGLCVEFNLRPNTFVYELLKEVKQAFISRRDREDYSSPKKGDEIQLIYQGKVLLEGSTLEEVALQPNDTVIAVIPALKEEKEEKLPQAEVDEERRRREELARQKEMMDFFAKQQEMMKENWAMLISKLNVPTADGKEDPFDKQELQAKMSSMEAAIHQQMRSEFEQMRDSLGSMSHKSRFIVGELEDDDDEHQKELERKIKLSNQRLREMEGKLEDSDHTVTELRKLQRAQQEELEELRRLIREFNRQPIMMAPQVQQQPAPVPVKRAVDSGGRKEPKSNAGKWNQFALAGKSAEPVIQQNTSRAVEEVVEVKEEVRKKPIPSPVKKVAPPVVASRPPVAKPQPKPSARMVTIVFPEERMTQLAHVAGIWGAEVEVVVEESIQADDLIFEIRRVIAEKAKIPLARVSLSVHGTDVFLAMDLPPSVQLSAATAPGLIRRGEMMIEVRNTITDAQLDSLGTQMENSDNEYLSGDSKGRRSLDKSLSLRRSYASNSESETEKVYSDTLRNYSKVSRPNRNYDSGSDSDGELEEDNIINHFRNSLSSTLVGLDDMKGLTDEELERKMDNLKSSLDVLPKKTSRNLSGHRDTVPGTVSAAIDSGSEDYLSSDNGRSKRNQHVAQREKSLRLAPDLMHSHDNSNTLGGPVEGIGLRKKGSSTDRRLFSSSLTLSRGSAASGRMLRDYDSQDDNEPVFLSRTDNLSGSVISNISKKSSPQTRYSSARDIEPEDDEPPDDTDSDEEDRLALAYLEQYEQEQSLNQSMMSASTAEEKRDYRSSVAASAKGEGGFGDNKNGSRGPSRSGNNSVEDFNDTSSTGSGNMLARLSPSDLKDDRAQSVPRSDHMFSSTEGTFDISLADEDDKLGTTVNTDISMPINNTESFDLEESVNKRADEYERDVQRETPTGLKPPLDGHSSNNNHNNMHSGGLHTPNSRQNSEGSQNQLYSSKYSNDTSSPFDGLHSDMDEDNDVDMLEGSLDLSQSADAFGHATNLELSSFSKKH